MPILGPTWRGIFDQAPSVGNFFSWKKKPQTVYTQSLVLTTSFISPTAMGLAVLYPTKIDNTGQSFATQREAVDNYKRGLFIAGRE